MKRLYFMLMMICPVVLSLAGELTQTETIQKEFAVGNPDHFELIVDNIWGSVNITGGSGNSIEAVIRKTIAARSETQMQRAVEEVSLDISDENSLLEFYVDGPFRDRNRGRNFNHWDGRKYRVIYEFELKVPQNISIDIRTVNDGDINIENVHGDYKIQHVNGKILMKELKGSGTAKTINGDLICYFKQNPQDSCTFGSLNGDVKLYFQEPLSAEFAMKTFNGDAFSDFPLTYVSSAPEITRKTNGEIRYRSTHRHHAKAGKGGPIIKLDGFNGDLLIMKYHKGDQS